MFMPLMNVDPEDAMFKIQQFVFGGVMKCTKCSTRMPGVQGVNQVDRFTIWKTEYQSLIGVQRRL